MRRILTIAGSDSGGGAGIQADLKTIAALGGYGMSAITAVTAQNTLGVTAVHEVPASVVAAQIDAVLGDIGADWVKTGMLASAATVLTVAECLRRHGVRRLVVDPVMLAESGHRLLDPDGCEALARELLPLAYIVTPNLAEAAALTTQPVGTVDEMERAASAIAEMGPRAVLVKGGHLEGDAVDVLWDGCRYHRLSAPRAKSRTTHGTGCTFSSALATLLASHVSADTEPTGAELVRVARLAKQLVHGAIEAGVAVGAGRGPVNPLAWSQGERSVLDELTSAMAELRTCALGWLVPEVRSNIGYALPYAATGRDVAAFPGRITDIGGTMHCVAPPEFGASRHVASVVLAVMHYFPEMRAAMNVRCEPRIIAACRRAGLELASFCRDDEPADVHDREGSSLDWGVRQALANRQEPPDAIFDLGGQGKEPIVRILGRTPSEVVAKVRRIAEVVEP